MGRIRILSDQVANQIAAGEVVERPASVVKELLENSLDAGATRIRIEVEGGGRKLIRIVDNGHGMVRTTPCLPSSGTPRRSCISSDDLLQIRTLGFRGGSAAVDCERVAADAGDSGYRRGVRTSVEIAGGKIIRVEDAGMPPGTTIAVRDLFYQHTGAA